MCAVVGCHNQQWTAQMAGLIVRSHPFDCRAGQPDAARHHLRDAVRGAD